MSENKIKQALFDAGWVDYDEKIYPDYILLMRGLERVKYCEEIDNVVGDPYEVEHPEDYQITRMLTSIKDDAEPEIDITKTLEHVRNCEVCEKNARNIVETMGFVREVFENLDISESECDLG